LAAAVILGLSGLFVFRSYEENKRKEAVVYPTKEVTIPEGYSAKQIDQLLVTAGIVREGGNIANFDISRFKDKYWFLKDAQGVEGFLFPDTYEFYLDSTPEVVVEKFLDNFQDKTSLIFMSREGAYDRVVLASLVEKEVPEGGDDRRLVAGLLVERMREGMRLQVDATLCYAKEQSACSNVRSEDKHIDSPYNTYTHAGLPPGPISNPGISALRAALAPKKSDYLFYISDPRTKKTIFAKTLDEHNQNIVKYLR
jgi:UPF0755 protein